MNHSHFIRRTRELGIDFQELWLDSMRNKDDYSCSRAFDDGIETRFWEKFSREYDQKPSLFDYAPQTLDQILGLTGKGKTMIEIGCGTGKFTLPMLAHARHITAIDFSPHMLGRLISKLLPNSFADLTLIQGKWEDMTLPPSDAIYSVNATYRMQPIQTALEKMDRTALEKAVIVWTMQRSVYDHVLNAFGPKGVERNQEYIHLMVLLYEMGIDPELEFMDTSKPVLLDEAQVSCDLAALAGKYGLPPRKLIQTFMDRADVHKDQIHYRVPLKVAFIHWTPAAGRL